MTDGSRITLLEAWMKDKEGENLEFKSARGGFHSENLAKYCCALANEGGGRIILGVTDARPRQVVFTSLSARLATTPVRRVSTGTQS